MRQLRVVAAKLKFVTVIVVVDRRGRVLKGFVAHQRDLKIEFVGQLLACQKDLPNLQVKPISQKVSSIAVVEVGSRTAAERQKDLLHLAGFGLQYGIQIARLSRLQQL